MDSKIIIGLEVHVQLSTETKMFCGCSTKFGAEPNTQVCPVCLGMPGVLPVINKKAFEYALKAAMALNCEIAPHTKFDRKNYYYPDLPKNYQISQYDLPFSHHGHLEIPTEKGTKKIRITRVHLEEDAGKLIHSENQNESYVDLNRAGTPLMEIVSEPDINSPEEAAAYLKLLRLVLRYLDVSDCNMQEGSLRCDANINLHITENGTTYATPLAEIKNMNSFKGVQQAMAYEAGRQLKQFQATRKTKDEMPKTTRAFDAARGITTEMRAKEEAHDYRYFPEPDLPPITIDEKWLDSIRTQIPELPTEKYERFIRDYGLPAYDADVLIQDQAIADYFEDVVRAGADAKLASNWVMGEVMRELNERKATVSELGLAAEKLAKLVKLISANTISTKIAREIFPDVLASGKDPADIVTEKGLVQISDTGELDALVEKVIGENPKAVEDFKSGKKNALSFLMGQVMRLTKGKANPKIITELLQKKLQ